MYPNSNNDNLVAQQKADIINVFGRYFNILPDAVMGYGDYMDEVRGMQVLVQLDHAIQQLWK